MEQHLRLVSIPSLPGNALTPAPYPEKRKLVWYYSIALCRKANTPQRKNPYLFLVPRDEV